MLFFLCSESNFFFARMRSQKISQWHKKVRQTNQYNFLSAKIPVHMKLNLLQWKKYTNGYEDLDVLNFLEFGWHVGFEGNRDSVVQSGNHASAICFSEHVSKYVRQEVEHGALIGPFDDNPLCSELQISPLSSVDKDADNRRTIVDLSFPLGNSVNDHIQKKFYLGQQCSIEYPSVDRFRSLVYSAGRGCLMFKRDLSRAYRQFAVDPLDYNLLGIKWENKFYVDTALPMGLRSAAQACQRVTSAISYMARQNNFIVLNYLDDFFSVGTGHEAMEAFIFLSSRLSELGLQESFKKAVKPSTCLTVLGVQFDSDRMVIEVTPDRMSSILAELHTWLSRAYATKREFQSLLGKLSFVSKCVRPARVFVNRLLVAVRNNLPNSARITVSGDIKRDIYWWFRFLPKYNGVSMIVSEEWSVPDGVISTYACLSGCGGVCGESFFHAVFPEFIQEQKLHINALEILALLVAIKVWSVCLHGKRVRILCDNEATCIVINTGDTRDSFMQAAVREFIFLQSTFDFEVRADHIAGVDNRLADSLSRWHLDGIYKERFIRDGGRGMTESMVDPSLFAFTCDW